MSTTTAPVRYRIPEYVAFVHAEEISEYASVTTYLADTRTAQVSVLEGSASIIWGIFEEPFSLPEALELIAELTEQNPEDIRGEVEGLCINSSKTSCWKLSKPALPHYMKSL